jgi:ribosomal-protein-alanine N-acetyltransferase
MIRLQNIDITPPEIIQRLANNHAIAVNLRDVFPHPYTLEDAITFLELVKSGSLGYVFGIYSDEIFVGCCSLIPQQDVYRINAEIGYWIGEPHWGKGYATEAIKLLVDYAFHELNLLRVYAYVFEYNTASMQVLEKVGFEKDAVINSSIIKKGQIFDEHLYSMKKHEKRDK